MAYMNIPGVVEAETLHSAAPQLDGKTFYITIDVGNTALELNQASIQGRQFELVVLALDSGFVALDDVYVTNVAFYNGDPPSFFAELVAREIRYV